MKKYQFRLEPVLKLRKLKEENCRMELGQLIIHLSKIENQLTHDRTEIDNYFNIQEIALKTGVRGGQLQAFPMLVEAKEKNIQLLLRDKKHQETLIEEKKKELAQLRGDLKVMDTMKENDFTDWRKAYNKEVDKNIEEQTQIWMSHKDKKVAL